MPRMSIPNKWTLWHFSDIWGKEACFLIHLHILVEHFHIKDKKNIFAMVECSLHYSTNRSSSHVGVPHISVWWSWNFKCHTTCLFWTSSENYMEFFHEYSLETITSLWVSHAPPVSKHKGHRSKWASTDVQKLNIFIHSFIHFICFHRSCQGIQLVWLRKLS